MSDPLLSVEISADYPERPDVLQGVRFDLYPGEIFGLIGPSGSGKSTLALAVSRLLELRGARLRGRLAFDGMDLMTLRSRDLRRLWGRRIALVPQSPASALNPVLRIDTQLREVWRAHRCESWRAGRAHARELLARMGLPNEVIECYPRQLSVGQAQRVAIAMAVMHRPALLIADEPTSALDPPSAAGILDLFRALNRDFGTAILYVSHDLKSVAELCHTVGVLRHGCLIDCGPPTPLLGATAAAAPPPSPLADIHPQTV